MMRGLALLALLGLLCVATTLGCAPVPGGQTTPNVTAGNSGVFSDAPPASPQVTSAAE